MSVENPSETQSVPWALLGVGGALGLCCLLATPSPTLAGALVQVAVTVLTVVCVGLALRLR